ncbi:MULTISPECIES: class I SAM-dependent methyltransferase [unclassified Moorena]|uniref:class I SAM-dependent methyltransferase n=1 Tax=unclassified Moorena TaxID=2683338 RepID=UPI0013FE7443|nr:MULTISPECIES: class I SAM-dependent methyltransferase [unclassified Moorena]NEO12992.1 class I SAM-dependent methyltransferase [Moorena sp. SIO3E8]NEQ02895.1 class I SAM-dependent methyltransferase [Moorena sp. SIO3F7]
MYKCQVCGNTENNKPFFAKEMMFGFRDKFEYFECPNCGCVQIVEIPANLSKYYPEEYYAYGDQEKLPDPPKPINLGPPVRYWVELAGVGLDAAILDVGSGAGRMLLDLHEAGYSNLTGVDPYIKEDLNPKPGVRVLNRTLDRLEGSYDFIMLHHSYEHIPDPVGTLQNLHKLLKPNQLLLLRIPVAGSYAWKKYGAQWVQLDPPRHLFLHTNKSIRILAETVGFSIEKEVYDSNGFQFYGSELYQKGITLMEFFSTFIQNPEEFIFFSYDELQEFEDRAVILNQNKEGDQACFYLRKEGE